MKECLSLHKKSRPDRRQLFYAGCAYFFLFSHFWFATPQLVLQADWQEVWHSPQPPFLALSQSGRVFKVLILFITYISPLSM